MNETLVDPELAADGGRQISTAAATAAAVVPGLVERVRAGCAAVPWGGDEAGRACDAAFRSIPGILGRVTDQVQALVGLGENIQTGAQGAANTDEAARDRILAAMIRSGLGGVGAGGS
jgi:hypothetical protein